MSNSMLFLLILVIPIGIYILSRMISAGYFRSRLSYDRKRNTDKQDFVDNSKDEVNKDG